MLRVLNKLVHFYLLTLTDRWRLEERDAVKLLEQAFPAISGHVWREKVLEVQLKIGDLRFLKA